MPRIDKTVFLSYRRTNAPWALAIYHELTSHGYDVFFDFNGIASGDFESVIIENIRSRAHFIVLLTPSALERCGEPGDWLRREIETALSIERNIIPLMLEGFAFGSPGIAGQLTGALAPLKKYNALRVPVDYFDEAMDRLINKFLNVPLESVLHPASAAASQAARTEQAAANAAPVVREHELTAQEWFEKAFDATGPDEQIRLYTEAVRLKPDYSDAFNNRGEARRAKGDLDGAFQDYEQAIRFQSDNAHAFNNRGLVRRAKGDLDGALRDYDQAIRLNRDFAVAFNNRGGVLYTKNDLDGALRDFEEAIRIKPDYADALNNRGLVRRAKGDLDGAIQDLEQAIRFQSDNAENFNNRGVMRRDKGDLDGALQDYDQAIRLNPDYAEAFNNRGIAREAIGDLESALQDYDQAIRLKPEYAEAFFLRGTVRQTKGDLEGALQDYDQAIRFKPELANAYQNRAELWQEKDNPAAAIADFQKYLDLGGGGQDGSAEKAKQMIAELKQKL